MLPYQQTAEEVVAGLGSHLLRGLISQEAWAERAVAALRLCLHQVVG